MPVPFLIPRVRHRHRPRSGTERMATVDEFERRNDYDSVRIYTAASFQRAGHRLIVHFTGRHLGKRLDEARDHA